MHGGCGRVATAEEIVRPREEVLPIWRVGMSAIVLPPCQLAVEQPDIHGWHFRAHVIVADAESARAEQTEHWLCRDRRHEASLVIEPTRVTLLRDAVAH